MCLLIDQRQPSTRHVQTRLLCKLLLPRRLAPSDRPLPPPALPLRAAVATLFPPAPLPSLGTALWRFGPSLLWRAEACCLASSPCPSGPRAISWPSRPLAASSSGEEGVCNTACCFLSFPAVQVDCWGPSCSMQNCKLCGTAACAARPAAHWPGTWSHTLQRAARHQPQVVGHRAAAGVCAQRAGGVG